MAAAPRMVVLCDTFPEVSQTFVRSEVLALRALGAEVAVEAVARPVAPEEGVRYWVDDTTAARAAAMARLALRHPVRCLRDLLDRRRWRREERVLALRMLAPAALRYARGADHVHVHFAAGAALAALRIARIVDVPWSVTAHGYDIFKAPANLAEKLRGAAFATSGSDYTVAALREAAPGAPVERVVMGVDGERFRRRRPHPAGRTVLAVGRLVEKKGFGDLVRAAAELDCRVRIAGDGPLRDQLLGPNVELLGEVDHDGVRALLEEADVLCMPCVVAADGDRDSMPVVVKEALAMEVPVVATQEVGLPEVVRPEWGRLVAPHDPGALAAAIDELLALAVERRAEMGRAGRAHVLRHCSVQRETAKLLALISATRGGRRGGSASPPASAS